MKKKNEKKKRKRNKRDNDRFHGSIRLYFDFNTKYVTTSFQVKPFNVILMLRRSIRVNLKTTLKVKEQNEKKD